jgi:luciferase family oxidoreductase group 1
MLDIGPVGKGSTPAEALRATRTLAQHAERLGFARFWVAEHHNAPNIATAAPAVILGVLGAATERIRLGSGGVMLPNHPPLVVAEQFGTLSAYYPGRVDLGIGRAPGTDPVAAQALRRLPTEAFPGELRDLLAFLDGGQPEVMAVPGNGSEPEVWLLGSGNDSAVLAGSLGLPYAFAYHIKAAGAVEALTRYRESFQPSARLAKPRTMISVQVVCAEDDAHAKWLTDPSQISFLRKGTRTFSGTPYPTPEEAAALTWTAEEREIVDERQASQAIGGPDTVRQRLTEILAATTPDELMIMNVVTDVDERLRSMDRVRSLVP